MTDKAKGLMKALHAVQQYDDDGVMCIASLQACIESAVMIEALLAENERLREALVQLCFHWDENLSNLDWGAEFEARENARAALQEKVDG